MAKVELYFRTARKGHRPVSNTDWAHFVEAQIGPRFPGGFTVLKGQGRWRTSRGAIVKETSHVLVLWYRPAPSVEAAIEAIRVAYRRQFLKNRSCASIARAAYHSNRCRAPRASRWDFMTDAPHRDK
jgi:hypothetical protein